MKKFLLLVLALFLLYPINSFSGQIKQVKAIAFHSNGAHILGWYWLRQSGHFAEWNVNLPNDVDLHKPMALCFSTLSTNTFSGGAGYDSGLSLRIMPSRKSYGLRLINDSKCLKGLAQYYNGNSHGIGYHSHGCIVRRIKPIINENGIKKVNLMVSYSGGHHTAVNKDSLTLIYISK